MNKLTATFAPMLSALALLVAGLSGTGCIAESPEGDEAYSEDYVGDDDGSEDLGSTADELKYMYVWSCSGCTATCWATTGDGHYTGVAPGACQDAPKPNCCPLTKK